MPRASASASAAAASTAWTGAPPVTENGFSFANGEFFADASNQNRHRRATPGELQNHFDQGTDKDHPAHWFEAQLIHYGLQPSKTKSVARMRLFDAVKANTLAVPTPVSKLEAKLKKEWGKKDREAKKALKDTAASQAKPKPAAGAKRKAADDDAASSKAKKAKTPAATPTKITTKTITKTVTKTTTKTTTKTPTKPKEPSAAKKKAAAKAPAKKDAAPTRKVQTARRGGISQGPSRSAPSASAPSSSATPVRPGRARRSGAFAARGRIQAPSEPIYLYDDDDDDENECYVGYSDQGEHHDGYSDEDDGYGGHSEDSPPPPYSEYGNGDSEDDGDTYPNDTALAPLGLLNGNYSLSSAYVTSQWSNYGSSFDLVLTLSGSTLWGKFDLGVVEGIMYFQNRPMQSSNDSVSFEWRGREAEGPIMYRNNYGHVTFLGDGRIEGQLDFMSITFRGRRDPGQGMRSSVSVNSMQNEWNRYSEEEYERERVSRW